MASIFLLTVLMVLSMQEKSKVAGYITACYFTSWYSRTSLTQVRLPVEDVDPSLCTHLLYAFANVDIPSMSVAAANPDDEYSYKKFNQLKSRNPNLKTLLSVGGQGSGADFPQLSSSLQQFAQNTIKFLREHGFDGLDVDWEYPTAETKDNFTFLLKVLSEDFSNEATNKEPLLLTIAGAGGVDTILDGYDIKAINKYLDYIFVMTYDFSGSWNKVTGFDSPLRARNDSNFSPVYNVQYALNVWINGGADRSKVIMGLTGAGASFILRNISDHNVGAPVQDGGSPPGPLYQQKGRLIYPEICQSLKKGWTRVWDDDQQVPYAYRGNQWVGYDDQQSFGLKVQYVIDEHLGGVMFWELSFDDAKNYCKNGAFPLLHTVKQTFANHPMDSNKTSTSETSSTDAVSQTSGATEENPTTPSHRMITTDSNNVAGYITACYFTSWYARTSLTQVRLPVEDVDPSLCTHLMYAFANVDIPSMSVAAAYQDDENSYKKFNQLKSRNPNLKTLLSVGGQGSGSFFSQLFSPKLSLQQFAQNTIKFLREHGFDGLDVDWEYPTAETKDKFTFLLKVLSEEFSNEATNKEPLLLTIAGAGGVDTILAGYDIKAINKYLDYIFVMTYNFSGSWNKVAGFDSPLRARNDSNFSPVYNVQYALNVWINGGADRSKVIMGLTGAGASFTLRNISDHNVGAPVQDGGGPPGPLYQQQGRLIYPEICQSLKKGWTRVWDDDQQVPYAYSGVQWVGYDDQQSFGLKVQYVIDEHLGGVMFWELSFDDAKNNCKNGAFPLLHIVKQTFANHPMDSNKTSTSETGSTDAPSHRTKTTDSNNGITFTGTTSILVLTVCGVWAYL